MDLRRLRWSTLVHGSVGLVAAGMLAGDAVVGGVTADLPQEDSSVHRTVLVLRLARPSDEALGAGAGTDLT